MFKKTPMLFIALFLLVSCVSPKERSSIISFYSDPSSFEVLEGTYVSDKGFSNQGYSWIKIKVDTDAYEKRYSHPLAYPNEEKDGVCTFCLLGACFDTLTESGFLSTVFLDPTLRISFSSSPHVFYDGYTAPLASAAIGTETYLDLKTGQRDILGYYGASEEALSYQGGEKQ
jgi:hypothetical protein